MAIKEAVTGNNSVAITGTASAGEKTVGVKGIGDSVGVRGEGKGWHGVEGIINSANGGHGVFGMNTAGGTGVVGTSTKWIGVYGETAGIENGPAGVWGEHKGAGVGVKAVSKDGVGLAAYSTGHEAIHAKTTSPTTAAIAAYNANPSGTGAAIFAEKEGTQGHAGFFVGNVAISGNLILQGVSIQTWLQRIVQLEQQPPNAGQLVQRVSSLEQKVAALESQLNTAISNLTGRVTQAEFAISDLKARVTQLGG